MTGPSVDVTAGRVGIRVLPDTSGFSAELKALLARIEGRTKVDVPTDLDTTQARSDAEKLKAETERQRIRLQGSIDLAEAKAKIAQLREEQKRKLKLEADVQTAQAKAQIQALRDQQRAELRLQLSVQTAQAKQQLDLFRLQQQNDLKLQLQLQTSQARADLERLKAELRAQNVDLKASIDRSRFLSDVASMRSRVEDLGSVLGRIGKNVALASTVALAAGALQAATASAIGLVAALSQAAGVAALIPAALAGLGAILATAVLGFKGVGSALSAAGKTTGGGGGGGSGGDSAATERARARAIEQARYGIVQADQALARAERDVADAQKEQLDAQQALTDARAEAQQQLEDLRLQVSGAAIDERKAAQDLAKAQEDLANATFNGVTGKDLDAYVLAVDEAKQRVAETAQNYKELSAQQKKASKAGVEGSDVVIEAQERLAAANRQVGDTQQALTNAQQEQVFAQERLADALAQSAAAASAAGGGVDQFAEAMAKLSPNARAAVLAILALKPAFTAMQLAVQNRLFQGLAGTITALGNAQLPVLRAGLVGIAGPLNDIVTRFLQFGTTTTALQGLSVLFDNTRASVAALAPALAPFQTALTDLVAVGSGFLPGLAQQFASFVQGISGALSGAADSGALATFIQNSITAFGQLAGILKNVGSILASVFSAANQTGGGLLNNLKEITGAVADFFKSAEGQQALSSFFTTAKDILSAILPILAQVAPVVAAIVAQIGPLVQAIGPVLAAAIAQIAPVLTQFAGVLAGGLGQVVTAILPALAAGIAALGPGISTFIAALAPALSSLAPVFTLLGKGLGEALTTLAPVLGPLAAAFAALAKNVVTLLPILVKLITPLLVPLLNAFQAIQEAIGPLYEQLASQLQPVFDSLGVVLQSLVPVFTQLLTAIAPIVAELVSQFAPILVTLAPLLGALVQLVGTLLVAALTATLPLIQLMGVVFQALKPVLDLVVSGLTIMVNFINDKVQAAIVSFKTQLMILKDFFVGIWNTIKSTVSGAITGIRDVITGAGAVLMVAFRSVFDPIRDVVVGIFAGTSDALRSALNGMIGVLNSAIGFINSNLIDTFNSIPLVADLPHIPQIPKLAIGADVLPSVGGTLALIAEGGKSERVIDAGKGNANLEANTKLAYAAIAALSQSRGGGGRPIQVTVPQLDASQLAREINRLDAFMAP